LVRGTALVLTFGIFAVAYPTLRYSAEAKPYGCDLFLALVMLTLLVCWLRRPDQSRWLWGLAALIVPAVGFSYPALFVGGGVSLVIGYVLWTTGRRGWRPWIALNCLLVASFVAMLFISKMAVGEANQARMTGEFWADTFPPLGHPLELIGWFFSTHTGSMMAYPVGGPGGGSTLTFICCAAGLAMLVRRRQWFLLGLLAAPLALNFVAAAMQRFPYGGHMKLSLYAATTFCVLMGLGIVAIMQWAAGLRKATYEDETAAFYAGENWATPARLRPLLAVLLILVVVAAVSLLHDLTHPYKSATTLRAREFAQWFWFDLAHDSEMVCLETDLGGLSQFSSDENGTVPIRIVGARDWRCVASDMCKELKSIENHRAGHWGWSSLYLCNQRIYSPRHARGELPQFDRVSADRPLRCVMYCPIEPRSDRLEEDWLQGMQGSYRLVARDRYPMPIYNKWDAAPTVIDDCIEVFKFVPLPATAGKADDGRSVGQLHSPAATRR
jgi:hypothetical protein